jgi:membrane-bound metal-dependent hydrolase YbcI (DUF457 family)
MYALGHLALGYFAASLIGRTRGGVQRLLFVWFFSLLPDIDLLLPFFSHRGATHSFAAILILVSASLLWRESLPYTFAYTSHILVGDLVTGGSSLLWPFRTQYVGFRFLVQPSLFETVIEIILFTAMLISLYFKKDLYLER